MQVIKPADNYIVKDNGDGTGEWVIDNNYYTLNNALIIKTLIYEATLAIAILQDAIDVDEAEDGDADKLEAWKKYRVLLSKVYTSVEVYDSPPKT